MAAKADEETGILIDSLMVSVGSTNLDPRSFHLNDEANLNNYAADFARRHVDVFNADLSRSRRGSRTNGCSGRLPKNLWSMPRRSSAQL